MTMSNQKFRKEERLKSRKLIKNLFQKANTIGKFPLLLLWNEIETTIPEKEEAENNSLPPVQFALSVSKRNFKKAVDRNELRRKVRETYRLNKSVLYEGLKDSNKRYAFMVLYTGKEKMSSKKIDKSMRQIIDRFLRQIKI